MTALNVKEKGDKEKRKEETKEKTIVSVCVCGKKNKKKEITNTQQKSLSLRNIYRRARNVQESINHAGLTLAPCSGKRTIGLCVR